MFVGAPDTSFREILSSLECFVATLEPGEYAPDDVPVVLKRIARAEKLCGTARLLMAKRAAGLRIDQRDGHSSPAKWMANQSGESVGKARRDLDTAERLGSQPDLEQALRVGDVSPTQAAIILPALEADPDAASQLIEAAKRDSLNELRDRSQSIVASRRSEEDSIARDARLREQRYLHIRTTEEGAVAINGELAPVEGAVVKNALETMKRRIFDEARREGRRESHEAYMADALVALCRNGGAATGADTTGNRAGSDDGTPDSGSTGAADAKPADGSSFAAVTGTPRAEIVLHVSAEALRRGNLESGEFCEIEGVGPVSLATVEYLFGNAWAKLIIEEGVDIKSVTHFGRWVPARLQTALTGRDRVCAVPGCGITYGLERDHSLPVNDGGPTELANLVRLCKRHHYLKTHKYWRLIGEPGAWQWVNVCPNQNVVADGDDYDVARPGEPTAGLARPILRPKQPLSDFVMAEDDVGDEHSAGEDLEQHGPDAGKDADSVDAGSGGSAGEEVHFEQQVFACSCRRRSGGPRVTVRLTPEFLASLAAEERARPDLDVRNPSLPPDGPNGLDGRTRRRGRARAGRRHSVRSGRDSV